MSKSKEAILDDLEIESQGDYFRDDVLKAMDEHAKNRAIAFAEWKDAQGFRRERGRKNKEKVYGKWYMPAAGYGGGEPTMYTSDELYDLFIQSEKNKQS